MLMCIFCLCLLWSESTPDTILLQSDWYLNQLHIKFALDNKSVMSDQVIIPKLYLPFKKSLHVTENKVVTYMYNADSELLKHHHHAVTNIKKAHLFFCLLFLKYIKQINVTVLFYLEHGDRTINPIPG